MKFSHVLLASACAAALSSIVLTESAHAQTQNNQIETVVVTAEKRSQDIQTVPVTVDAFNADQLRQSNINNINDLQKISPSLLVYSTTSGASDTSIKIRGVGTTGNNPGLEGAVGTFIDGVYRNRSGLALGDLVDVSQVEVLEGPQSTLFGKNTSAGALNIATNLPDQTHDAFLEAGVSNYAGYKVDGWINIPISDQLSTRWVGVYDKRDGYVTDENDGQKLDNRDRYFLKGQALWTPNNDVSLRVIADFSHGNEDCCGVVRLINGATSGIVNALEAINGNALTSPAATGPGKEHYDESLSGDDPYDFQDDGASAELNWQLNNAVKLTDIVAYRDFSQTTNVNASFSGADLFTLSPNHFADRVFSEELRLSGHADFSSVIKSIDWLTGVYYTDEQINVREVWNTGTQNGNYWCAAFTGGAPGCFTGSASTDTLPLTPFFDPNLFVPGPAATDQFATHEDSFSAFAQGTFNITDRLVFTGGLRGSTDSKTGSFIENNTNPAASEFGAYFGDVYQWNASAPVSGSNLGRQSLNSSALTGTANLQYFWTDHLMTYVDYSRGSKDGGFNLDRTSAGIISGFPGVGIASYNPTPLNPAYKPEYSDNFEGGIKSKWFDDHLLINGTVFYEKFHDLQVLNFDGIDFHIVNMPTGTSKGFELQTEAALFDGFTVNSSVTYADTAYGSGATLPLLDLVTGYHTISLAGDPFTNAPLWSTTNGATYTFPLWTTGLSFSLHGDMYYGSSRNTGSDQNPLKEQGGYSLFNGRATLMGNNDRWELAAWCSNCTNKHYATVIFDTPEQSGSYSGAKYFTGGSYDAFVGEPAIYGLTASYKF